MVRLFLALALVLSPVAYAEEAPKDSPLVDVTSAAAIDGGKTFKAADGSWSLQHPAAWEVKKGQGGGDLLMAPLPEGAKFRANLNVKVVGVPQGTTALIAGRDARAGIARDITSVTVDAAGPLKTPAHAGYLLIYHAPFQAFELKWAQAVVVVDTKAYLVTFTAEAGAFDRDWPAVRQMLKSFKGR